jgi:transposase InsO family protein
MDVDGGGEGSGVGVGVGGSRRGRGRPRKGAAKVVAKVAAKERLELQNGSVGRRLAKIYYDPSHPAAYGSVQKLRRALPDISAAKIAEWVASQDPITLHKPARKKFSRLKIRVLYKDQQWQADLCDMQKYSDENNGYNYLLTVIDCFSKYAWALPLKSKRGVEIVAALKKIFKERKCTKLQTDRGKEFKNKDVQDFLKQQGVKFFTANNPDIKGAIVERFNRTLKGKMWRYFTHKNTTRYVEVLPKLLQSYNKTVHSSIKMPPSNVSVLNQIDVYKNIYGKEGSNPVRKPPIKYKFKPGDHVRIQKEKLKFEKGYEANFTRETFVIDRQMTHHRTHPVYKLKDLKGEELDSIFYEQELVRVGKPDYRKKHEIEKVLERKGNKVLVKWVGYPDSFNEWIPKKKGL